MAKNLEWFSTGCVPLNLALSQRGLSGGIPRGRITNFVGDGSSGKTLVTLETCAHSRFNYKSEMFPETKRISIHYNNPEEVMDFDLGAMYGDEFENDVIWKRIPTVEDCGYDVAKTLKSKKKEEGIIYVIDSLDALKPKSSLEEFNKIVDKGGDKKGSYDLDKQKYLTREFFPNICELMSDIDFTLIIISQTRDKIGGLFPEKTRSGGSALNFYTHLVPWFSESEVIRKTVDGQGLTRGMVSKCKVKRSKVSKCYREAETTIIFDYGVDNVESCLNYLLKRKESYDVSDVIEKTDIDSSLLPEKKINRSELVKVIEKNNLEDFLSNKVEEVWLAREEKLYEERKPKFETKKEQSNEDSKPKLKRGKREKTSSD